MADVPELPEPLFSSAGVFNEYQMALYGNRCYAAGRAAGLEEAASCADQWATAGELLLRAGEMTAQELRTAQAVAAGIAAAIRALKKERP